MFKTLRKASDALQSMRVSIAGIWEILRASLENVEQREALSDRVAALEVGYAKWSAEAEAMLLKADALFKNARNSEERARDKSKKKNGAAEPQTEGEAEIRAAYADLFGMSGEDVAAGVAPTLQPIDAVAGATDRETARNRRLKAKFR